MTRDLPAPTFSDDPILNIEINKALSHINHLMTRPCDVRTAVSRIESHNASSPLFLFVAFQAPHGPIMAPPATYMDMYSRYTLYTLYTLYTCTAARSTTESGGGALSTDTPLYR